MNVYLMKVMDVCMLPSQYQGEHRHQLHFQISEQIYCQSSFNVFVKVATL